ncbi:hypothetical protein SAY87_009208 [Trapa incisa]|uniref:Pulmonary surfactant-associated protein B n=1 Tax=Trapa incisa TaxID=236973 RepID=A0AAN7JW88_9MYRT|nr:hypothetical protein SAY87_009208 [Trapa incisa]
MICSSFISAVSYPGKELGDAITNDQVCTLCEEYTAMALDYLSKNKSQSEIIELLHTSCSQLHAFKSQCATLVDYYAPLFFLEISSFQPVDFCKKVNLCQNIVMISSQIKEDSCEFCQNVVSEFMDKLKDPDTQMDLIELLMEACNSMEKYAKKCKKMVFEYGPVIIANAEQFLEDIDVCAVLHVCTASTNLVKGVTLPTIAEVAALSDV